MSERRLALISGGDGDLARAIAAELVSCGMKVLAPGRGELDVTDEANVAEYARSLDKLDLLVCNAGLIKDQILARMSEGTWDELIGVNLTGAARVARLIGQKLERGGSLVLIGSYSGYHPSVGQSAYAASKAGLGGLNQSLAKEWGRREVRCNMVLPGFMETKMTSSISPESRLRALADHHLNRFNDAESVARFIRFLHSEMKNTSGQIFNLDSRIL